MSAGEGIIEKRPVRARRALGMLFLVLVAASMGPQTVAAQTANVFTYYGEVLISGGGPVPDGTLVTIRNVSRGDTLWTIVGELEPGKYQVTIVDILENGAATAGDSVEVTVTDSSGTLLAEVEAKRITTGDVSSRRLRTDFLVGVPDVVVIAPPYAPVDPGNSGVFVFEVYNFGTVTDSYAISVSNLHPEWLDPYTTLVGPVAPGEMVPVMVRLSVPADVDWTVYELIELEACSVIDPAVCDSDKTQAEVAVAVTFSAVRYAGDHIVVEWSLASDAVGLPYTILRRRSPNGGHVPLLGAEVEVTGERYAFRDYDVERGETYEYWLEIVGGETFVFPLGRAQVPAGQFRLEQNYPNPFNPGTRIRFELAKRARVGLYVYDVTGRRIRTLVENRSLGATSHTFDWDGTDDGGRRVTSGVYFCRLVADGRVLTRRMVLLK